MSLAKSKDDSTGSRSGERASRGLRTTATTEEKDAHAHYTDQGNAIRMVAMRDDLRHCHPWTKWIVWDGQHWKIDATAEIKRAAKSVATRMHAQASKEIAALGREPGDADPANRQKRQEAAIKKLKWALESENARRINAMIDLARSEPGIPILPEQLDPDPWLFNCPNGTLDLRTGVIREHRKEDSITKVCPTRYVPDAPCPVWQRFLETIFLDDDEEPDRDLIIFVQRLMGRCLTGDVSEQILPIFWGGGANGKSTLINAVLATMGPDYTMKANADLLMTSRGERHPTELASLFGMRLVVASETHEGRKLNEALVKDLTGGERIRARRMREDFWEFDPTHKVILLTNHKPRVGGIDEAIWRRLRLVPFTATFWDPNDPGKASALRSERFRQDKHLSEKLGDEREGILAWLVRGCVDWLKGGLTLPEKVLAATTEYRSGEDLIGQWIDEACVTGSNEYRARASALYIAYRAWADKAGESALTQTSFGTALGERGFESRKSHGTTWRHGIALRGDSGDSGDSSFG
jgi:putative DNA primase/helicase